MTDLATSAAGVSAATRALARRRRAGTPWTIYLYVLPAFGLLAFFSYYPFLSAFWHSLFDWDGVNEKFIGLKNFADMLHDDVLSASVPNILILTGMGVIFALTLPLIAAEFIYNLKSERARLIYRFAFTVPLVIPWVVTVLVWQFLYDPIDGPINGALTALGLADWARPWLSDPGVAIYAVGMIGGGGTGVGFPFVAGLNLLIYLAGLNNVPREIIDAARLDGVNPLQRFFFIDLPLIKGQIRVILVMTVITQLQSFQTIILLTRGGPGYATMVPGMAMYQYAFEFGRMGYASAIGVVLFAIMLVITLFALNRLKSGVEAEPR